jgi:hypothetical protein
VHAELGVDSMMSLLIYTDEQPFGALASTAKTAAGPTPIASP